MRKNVCIIFGIVFIFFIVVLEAQEVKKTKKKKGDIQQRLKLDYKKYQNSSLKGSTPSLLFAFFMLIFVGIAIVFSIWLLKKIAGANFSQGKNLRLVESLYIGNKTYIHIIEIAGKKVVIGSGAQNINKICELEEPQRDYDEKENTPPEKKEIKDQGFAKVLTDILQKTQGEAVKNKIGKK